VSNNQISLDLDTTLTPALIRGGYAREVVNRIQRERKERGFDVADRIHVSYQAEGDLALAISEHLSYIMGETLSLDMQASGLAAGTQAQVDGLALSFDLVRVPEGAQSRK
jgi:isoleucyl-tRNA synthetase